MASTITVQLKVSTMAEEATTSRVLAEAEWARTKLLGPGPEEIACTSIHLDEGECEVTSDERYAGGALAASGDAVSLVP